MLDGMKEYIEAGKMTDYQDHYYPTEMAVDAMIQTYLMDGDTAVSYTHLETEAGPLMYVIWKRIQRGCSMNTGCRQPV